MDVTYRALRPASLKRALGLCLGIAPLVAGCLVDNPMRPGEEGQETGETESGGEMDGQESARADLPASTQVGEVEDLTWPFCGDGSLDVAPGERCDDGNDVADDGCETDCQPSPGAAMLSVGIGFSCVVSHLGELVCFGANDAGQLGQGGIEPIGDDEVPFGAGIVFIWADVRSVAAGQAHACALDDDGGVWCWGANELGQAGLGGTQPTPFPDARVSIGGPALQIVAGDGHSCALRDDGAVYCWGTNAAGQLGYPGRLAVGAQTSPFVVGPVALGADAISLAAGGETSCARFADGTARCWGGNSAGQLGLGHSQSIGDDEPPASTALLDFESPIAELAVGERHACAVLEDGTLRCWGESPANGVPALGDASMHLPAAALDPVDLGSAAEHVACGQGFTCAATPGGKLRCFGRAGAHLGQADGSTEAIGDDEDPAQAAWVDVGGPVRDLAAGSHLCARLAAGDVRCFGVHSKGALGLPWLAEGEGLGDDEAPATQPPIELF